MSRLVDFYRGQGTDTEGRRLADLWAWDDEELEIVHDYIQWMFPLAEPSQFNPDAPLLTSDDIAAFQADPALRSNLHRSFNRFLTFLGLSVAANGEVVEGPNFASRVSDVWTAPNHNWLRITRLLRSLTVLGLGREAGALFDRLEAMHGRRQFPITTDTFQYWIEVMGR